MSEVKLYHPTQLDGDEWRELQRIQRDAFASTFDREPEEIDALVGWHDPDRYMASHLDPNTEVGRRYISDQSYTHPRVAVATQNREPIGFAYSAHNVSGATEGDRLVKRLMIKKNYLWMREIAVEPGSQQQGVAKQLGHALLKDAIPFQPVTAYIWPDDEPAFMQTTLEGLGFTSTGEQSVKVFGEASEPVKQVRMQARSVRTVLKNLR